MTPYSKSIDEDVLKEQLQIKLKDVIRHSICVSNMGYYVAKELGMPENKCYDIAVAGMMHDIGKIPLVRYMNENSDEEYSVKDMRYMRMHSKLSYDILKNAGYSKVVLDAILYHHENYDGTGYPGNLYGENIPVEARILRVCDVFSALISDRTYRSAFDVDTAVEMMIDEIENFDMKIFLAFQRVVHEVDIEKIMGNKPVRGKEDMKNG